MRNAVTNLFVILAQTVMNLPVMQDLDSIPGSRRSPSKGNDTCFQYSCLENPMERVRHNWVTKTPTHA